MNFGAADSIKLGTLIFHVDPVLAINRRKYSESSLLLFLFSFLFLLFYSWQHGSDLLILKFSFKYTKIFSFISLEDIQLI